MIVSHTTAGPSHRCECPYCAPTRALWRSILNERSAQQHRRDSYLMDLAQSNRHILACRTLTVPEFIDVRGIRNTVVRL